MCAILNRFKCLLCFVCSSACAACPVLPSLLWSYINQYIIICFVVCSLCCYSFVVVRFIVVLSLSLFVAACKSSLLSGKVHSFQNQNDLNRTNKNIFILAQFSKYIYTLKLYNIVVLYLVYSVLILQDDHAAQTATH